MTHESPTRAEMNARLDATQSQTLAATKPLEVRMAQFEQTVEKVMAGFTDLKRTVVLTGISTVLGVGALNAAILSNIQSSFDSGKILGSDIATIRAEMRAERLEMMADLKKELASLPPEIGVIKGEVLDLREHIGIVKHQLENKFDRAPGKSMPKAGRPTRELMLSVPQ